MEHEVYVIYKDGKPWDGARAAYLTKGAAAGIITSAARSEVRYGTGVRYGRGYWSVDTKSKDFKDAVKEERSRYEIVPYVSSKLLGTEDETRG
jgi:hypothetical protein